LSARAIRVSRSVIQSLERKRDSTKDGAIIGAAIGAGFGLFLVFAGDPHKPRELASSLATEAVTTAIGGASGWTIDLVRSKPHLEFEASPEAGLKIHVMPLLARDGQGLAVVASVGH
jgi:hypothetical protein